MGEKRYYWLKLKEDFFNQKEIKKLRKIAGGDTFTIIYLKMQLKSLQTNGSLFYEGFEDEFASELALEIDEDVDNIRVTLMYLEKHGLIEKIENGFHDEFFLPAVKESTGTETATAIRVRRHRRKQKALQSNNDVTQMKQIVTDVKHFVNGEREKELKLDKEKREREKLSPGYFSDNEDVPKLKNELFNNTSLNKQLEETTETNEKQKLNEQNESLKNNYVSGVPAKIIKQDIEDIYKIYPTHCFNGGGCTSRSVFSVDKMKKLIKEIGKQEIIEIIMLYLEDCRKSRRYLKNFKTLINNFPRREDLETKQVRAKQQIQQSEELKKIMREFNNPECL